MAIVNYAEISDAVREASRMKSFPLAVKFLKSADAFPEKTRSPARDLGKRITICQAVSMVRLYGWTVGLTKEDLICVPAMIAFGFSGAEDIGSTLGELFCAVGFHPEAAPAADEAENMCTLENDAYPAILMAPCPRGCLNQTPWRFTETRPRSCVWLRPLSMHAGSGLPEVSAARSSAPNT